MRVLLLIGSAGNISAQDRNANAPNGSACTAANNRDEITCHFDRP
jgi:hypothetical protein